MTASNIGTTSCCRRSLFRFKRLSAVSATLGSSSCWLDSCWYRCMWAKEEVHHITFPFMVTIPASHTHALFTDCAAVHTAEALLAIFAGDWKMTCAMHLVATFAEVKGLAVCGVKCFRAVCAAAAFNGAALLLLTTLAEKHPRLHITL